MNAGIYVQVPFCQTKCTYCNFHTGVFSHDLYAPYADAVAREIADYPRLLRENKIQEIPQTPGRHRLRRRRHSQPARSQRPDAQSSMPIRARFQYKLEEVTLEADPETITPEKASAWLAAGFDRISMGVQSFHDTELKAAGRMHRREDIFNAMRILRAAGFQKISADLIAGLPHQTAATWHDSVGEFWPCAPNTFPST